MSMDENNLTDQDRWLAAELALGVLRGEDMRRAQKRFEDDLSFRHAVEGWQNQLSPMLDEVGDVVPPEAVWKKISDEIAPLQSAPQEGGIGFWKLLTALSSTVAVGCFALLMYVTGGDFSGQEVRGLKTELAAAQSRVADGEARLDESAQQLASLEQELAQAIELGQSDAQALAEARAALSSAESEITLVQQELAESRVALADVREQISRSQPLVASLTQSGDAPAFVAQYDPLKQALLIRTSVADEDEKVPEIWLIPDQGDRKGEVLSLGVMDESAPDTVRISDELVPLIGAGGTLAITMEPPGGAPNGVATGPVIALGKLQAL